MTATTGSDSANTDGKRFVALCTGATGISSVHLIRHMQQDRRFSKIYGVSRRELYDVDTSHVKHIKLDLLDSQKVKEELRSQGVSDGVYRCSICQPFFAMYRPHAACSTDSTNARLQ